LKYMYHSDADANAVDVNNDANSNGNGCALAAQQTMKRVEAILVKLRNKSCTRKKILFDDAAANKDGDGGDVGTLQNGYICNIPLLRAPQIQSASHVTGHIAVTRDDVTDPGTCYLQDPWVPTCSNLGRSLRGLGRRQLLPLFPC
jgi:hypothetical protein